MLRSRGFAAKNGFYHKGEGHHRMAAALEIYKKTGDSNFVNKLIENGRWDPINTAPSNSVPMSSRYFWERMKNKLAFYGIR